MNINWFLAGVISVIGSIILSIIANLFTDPIKNWLAERSLISRLKRVEQLKGELEFISRMFQDKNNLALYLGSSAFSALQGLGLSLITLSIMSFIISGLDASKSLQEIITTAPSPGWEIARQIVFMILFMFAAYNGAQFFYSCAKSVRLIRRIRHFDKYKKEKMLQLDKFETTINVAKNN